MRIILKISILLLLVLTTGYYIYPLIEVVVDSFNSFELNVEWIDKLYEALRLKMILRTDLLLMMIFQILCLIALKKNSK